MLGYCAPSSIIPVGSGFVCVCVCVILHRAVIFENICLITAVLTMVSRNFNLVFFVDSWNVDIHFHFGYFISWFEVTLVPGNWLLLIHRMTRVGLKH